MIEPQILPRTTQHLARERERREALQKDLGLLLQQKSDIVWEVGCGHGHFLTEYAQLHPDRICVGADIIRERIERALRKRRRAATPNLHFVLADAWHFLDALPAHVKLAAIYVLFPDPWQKRRHHKNRLMQPRFLDALAKKAVSGARLFFRTDHEAYFTSVEAIFAQQKAWKVTQEPWPFERETVFQARAATYRSLIAVRTAAS